jgi:hypothetical protein
MLNALQLIEHIDEGQRSSKIVRDPHIVRLAGFPAMKHEEGREIGL